jgi:Spy/CpxP family protein refolding chaperone
MRLILLICIGALLSTPLAVIAQNKLDTDSAQKTYQKVITQRSNKIVLGLNIADSIVFYKVQNALVGQYSRLSALHDSLNGLVKTIKTTTTTKELIAIAILQIENTRTEKLQVLHEQFIANISSVLSASQIAQLKDGMTYSILPITLKAYEDMLPNLTAEQKTQINTYLTEAREFAMDAESSEKKHAWFGKYKGKINNYLSAAGIDMKKAGQEWEERRKAKKTT